MSTISDGGHFENLGIYDVVRRYVRFIICSDPGADPQFAFGDLGNAIDRCRRDFGIEIKTKAQTHIAPVALEGFRGAQYAVARDLLSRASAGRPPAVYQKLLQQLHTAQVVSSNPAVPTISKLMKDIHY